MHSGGFHHKKWGASYILSLKQNILKSQHQLKVRDVSGKLLQQP